MRDGFIFYSSFQEAISELPEKSQLEVYKAVITYGLFGEEPTLSGIAKAMFVLMRPQIDANNTRYENGKKGGRPKKPNNKQDETKDKPSDNPIESSPEPKEKEKEKEKEKANVKEKEKEDTPLPNWLDQKAWSSWIQHRKEIRKNLTPTAIEQQLEFLEEHKAQHVEIIRQSTRNGWTGLFPLKQDKGMNSEVDLEEFGLGGVN